MVRRRYRGRVSDMTTALEPLELECPRCGTAVEQDFYGPCVACVVELRATMGTAPLARAAVAAAYEPKMNVTPNFIATKD